MKLEKTDKKILVILGIVFAAYSVVVFVLPTSKNAVFWLSYFFTILALASQFYIFRLSFKAGGNIRSKFYGFPIARIGVLYLAVQFVLGIVFMTLAVWVPVWVPVVLYLPLVATAALGLIAADTVRTEVERQDVQLKKDISTMRALQSRATALAGRYRGDVLSPQLQRLAEELRFSDPVSSDALFDRERELNCSMDVLEQAAMEHDTPAVTALCEKILADLAERNRLCKLGKMN